MIEVSTSEIKIQDSGKFHTDGRKSLKLCAVMRAKCIKVNQYVKGSRRASRTPSHVPPTSSSLPPLETRTLYWAISLSCSVRKRVLDGQSGRDQNAPIATMIEAIPSMRKNHCQACRPATLSMFSRIPAARKPEIMLLIVLPACQMAMRKGDSSLVYQAEVTGVVVVSLVLFSECKEINTYEELNRGRKELQSIQ